MSLPGETTLRSCMPNSRMARFFFVTVVYMKFFAGAGDNFLSTSHSAAPHGLNPSQTTISPTSISLHFPPRPSPSFVSRTSVCFLAPVLSVHSIKLTAHPQHTNACYRPSLHRTCRTSSPHPLLPHRVRPNKSIPSAKRWKRASTPTGRDADNLLMHYNFPGGRRIDCRGQGGSSAELASLSLETDHHATPVRGKERRYLQ